MTPPQVIDRFKDDYEFLSNFYPVEVIYPLGFENAAHYPSVEHAYQAAKTLDSQQRDWVRRAPTAGEANKRGQRVRQRPSWNDQSRIAVMTGLLRQKFNQEPFRSNLLATGDAELIESNYWHDQFWGDCFCEQHVSQGGLNWLGSLLMKIRSELRKSIDNIEP